MRFWLWQFEHRKRVELVRLGLVTILDEGLRPFITKAVRYVLRSWGRRTAVPKTPDDLPHVLFWVRRHRIPVSIVIPNYGQPDLLQRCVASLQHAGAEELIVVDDGSPPHVQEIIKKLPCRTICLPTNRGFSNAVIAGVAAARKINDIVILNSDAEAHPHWLDHLKFCAYRDARIGIVGPKLVYPNGSIQSAGSFRNVEAREWFDHYFRYREASYPPANVEQDVMAVTGAAMYIKRSVIRTIGGFDPEFPMAFEDVDYCLRARQQGFRVLYCPHAVLTHFEGASRGRVQGPRELSSKSYFWKKWGPTLNVRPVLSDSGSLRIIYVLQKTNIAGGHRDVFEHLNRLQERGHDVSLYALEGKPAWFDLNAPVVSFFTYGQLTRALAAIPAIKVATWWQTAFPVWSASLFTGIPVYFVQDVEASYYDETQPTERARVLASYRKEFHYLTISRWIQATLWDIGITSALAPPWYNTDLFGPDPLVQREHDVLLAIGRSHPLKNFLMTVRAWKAMTPSPRLWLFGVEPSVAEGLGATYFLQPPDRDVARLYRRATVFVQTSRHEGFGLPILEAMACGCPVVCTSADGNVDFCRDGYNCLIVPQDDAAALVRMLEVLLRDKRLQEKLRQGGYETVSRYRNDHLVDRLETFYLQLAETYAPYGHLSSRISVGASQRAPASLLSEDRMGEALEVSKRFRESPAR
ncbi:MAG: hypothetical protein G01um101438_379 [Parcubacteria group bacterium Gr01-1014_38]|nr:MAG: hypothetical protein G01um101438_379 [Parcubacteria group bacterium Gr01-1014_38]